MGPIEKLVKERMDRAIEDGSLLRMNPMLRGRLRQSHQCEHTKGARFDVACQACADRICKYGTDHSVNYCFECRKHPDGWYQAPWKITKDGHGDFLFEDWPNESIYDVSEMD